MAHTYLNVESKIVRRMEAESGMVVARGEQEMGSCCSVGIQFSLYKRNQFWRSAVHVVSAVNSAIEHRYTF